MILDTEELLEETDRDRDLLQQMFQIFAADVDRRMTRIRQAVADADAHTIAAEAHAIKGGVGNFFAGETYETAASLEAMGRANDLAEVAPAVAQLESQLEALKQAICDLIAR